MFLKPRRSPFFPEMEVNLLRETIWHSLRGKIKARHRSSEQLDVDRAEGSAATICIRLLRLTRQRIDDTRICHTCSVRNRPHVKKRKTIKSIEQYELSRGQDLLPLNMA